MGAMPPLASSPPWVYRHRWYIKPAATGLVDARRNAKAESFLFMSKAKNWTITSYNNEHLRGIPDQKELCEEVQYIVGQTESCPETGRVHFQGFIQFKRRRSMRQVKRWLGDDTVHLEIARGTAEENRAYCTKEETRESGGLAFELGTIVSQGERRDLNEMGEAALSGESLLSIAESNTASYARYHGEIRAIRQLAQRERTRAWRNVRVWVFHGDSGAGKSALARRYDPALFALDCAGEQRIVFDGYEGDKTLLIDDFYGNIRYNFLLRILDGYQLQLPARYANCYAEYDTVILTSNVHPDEWYKGLFASGMSAALKRRINEIFFIECQWDGSRISDDDMDDIIAKMRPLI